MLVRAEASSGILSAIAWFQQLSSRIGVLCRCHNVECVTHMRGFKMFAAHLLLWAIGTVVSVIVLFLFSPMAEKANPLFDWPYSPLLWGIALLIGVVANNVIRHSSGYWVWVIGALWLAYSIYDTLRGYDPRWCLGCSPSFYAWHSFFAYGDAYQEGLGMLFGTTPMLNSIAYSIGAAVGMRLPWNLSEIAHPKYNSPT